jgi:biotin carboxylase
MKVMILGANALQVRGIERIQEMGHTAIAVDNRVDSPGKKVAELSAFASTFDPSACLQVAKEMKIDGIFTSGTDQPVLTAALVQEAMGLPMPFSVELARRLTNKRWMKQEFEKNGLPTLPWVLIGRTDFETEIPFSFPAVLKPVDSQGQRGIFLVHSHKEIRTHIEETLRFSRESKALIEPFYQADEVTVSGWVAKGQTKILSIVDRETFQTPDQLGICLSHEYPTRYAKARGAELEELTKRIVDVFHINEGPIYFQFLIGDKGIVINEIAGRIGGAHEDFVIPRITGFDFLGEQIKLVLGEQETMLHLPKEESWQNPKLRASVQLFFVEPCVIETVNPPKPGEVKSLVEWGLHMQAGQNQKEIENATARAGFAIFLSESEEVLQRDVELFYQKMQILDAEGKNRIVKHNRRERD